MRERTLSIIKPDAVRRGLVGEILRRFEGEGFSLVGMKMIRLSKADAKRFYHVHEGKPFFEGLTDFMSSGPCITIVLEADDVISRYREMMGATDPVRAATGTIRKAFATDGQKNVVHGSDSVETADWEIAYFFSSSELVGL
jgi:nucleoside-diphosphate kinase